MHIYVCVLLCFYHVKFYMFIIMSISVKRHKHLCMSCFPSVGHLKLCCSSVTKMIFVDVKYLLNNSFILIFLSY